MEKTYNPALIQRTQRYMETHSISQNQFAAKVNLSSAALSSYLNQKYKGSVEAVERQLSEFFKLDEEAEAAAEKTASLLPRAAYVPTSISEDVCQSIRFAQLEHCMVVLHGDAGVGKSKGAQKFLRDHPTNAVGISITPSTGTLNGSIKLLARALRVPECRNKMDQMMALRSRLDGTNWVIVIDEAQHLKYAALEEIRSLTDDNPMTGEHGVGVVLIGNSEVYSRLQGRQQAQFAQLFSRIRMQREYTTRKVKEDDVRKLFPVLAEQNARKCEPEHEVAARAGSHCHRPASLSHGGHRQGIQEYAVWHVLQPRQGVRRIYYGYYRIHPARRRADPCGQRAACAGQCSARRGGGGTAVPRIDGHGGRRKARQAHEEGGGQGVNP